MIVSLFVMAACAVVNGGGSPAAACVSGENVEVVVPRDAAHLVDFAASELAKWLGKSLGTDIPIVTEPTTGRFSIILGDTELSRTAGIRSADLPRDAFVLKSAPNRLYIVGRDETEDDLEKMLEWKGWGDFDRREHATVFGVYAFLERYAGIRFYFPDDELGVVVPKRRSLTVEPIDRVFASANLVRSIHLGGRARWIDGSADSVAARRAMGLMHLRGRFGTYLIPCVHGQRIFAYDRRFARTHPEYFLMTKEGVRDPEQKGARHPAQLCHSSRIWDEVHADAKAYLTGQSAESRGVALKNKPEVFAWDRNCKYGKYVDVMPTDGMKRCYCPDCTKAYAPDAQFATELIWGNTKRLAERLIAERVPGFVTMMAYPPYGRVPAFDLPTNILVMVAKKGPWGVHHTSSWQADNAAIRAWTQKIGHKVWLWNYPGKWGTYEQQAANLPQMSPRAYAKYYKSVSSDIFGAHAESETERMLYNYLNHYVFARVMWDPSVDVEALLDEHYRLMFGAAAGEMKAFYGQLEDKWIDEMSGFGEAPASNIGPGHYKFPPQDEIWGRVYSPSVLAIWRQLFETALSRVEKGGVESRRLALIRSQFFEPLEKASADFMRGGK